MKIILSKNQWKEIGKIAGWTKIAQMAQEISDFKVDSFEDDGHMLKRNFIVSYSSNEITGCFYYELETEQKGGSINPSWPSHFYYSRYEILEPKGYNADNELSRYLNVQGENYVPDIMEVKSKFSEHE